MIYLLNCALYRTAPQLSEEPDYRELYKRSRYHSVAALTGRALELGQLLSETHMEEALKNAWMDAKNNVVRRSLLFDAEREQILKFLEEQKIWYVPLKGCVLKDMYPEYGLRQMADNDILFDESGRKIVRNYMEARGYKSEQFKTGVHDMYQKPPVFNFEFHVKLFETHRWTEWASYYENIKERLEKEPGNQYGYCFSDEDFYIYFILHMCKHYQNSGTGIRSLVDLAVYMEQKAEKMDWNYIQGELEKLQVSEFEQKVRTLAVYLFAAEKNGVSQAAYDQRLEALTPEQKEMLCYLLGSGTYGTTVNLVQKKLAEVQGDSCPISRFTKLKFCLKRLFPGMEYMKMYVPFCYRHKWCIPFFWIYRLFRGLIKRRRFIQAEIRALKKVK